MSLLVLSANDVDALVSEFQPEELQLMMARLFCRFSSQNSKGFEETRHPSIFMPPRLHLPMINHTALFMPARIGPNDPKLSPALAGVPGDTSVKVVCVPNQIDSRGLPATTMVLDESTGRVKAIVNARRLTALRNAAGSLLSTSLFSFSRPESLVSFGAGQQIEAHLDLHLRHFPSIARCMIINRTTHDRAVFLHKKISSKFPRVTIQLIALDQRDMVKSALESADIIICATPSTVPLFPASFVRAGTHIILIGSYTPEMKEVDKELILRALGGRLLVDSRVACSREAGELIGAGVEPEQMKEVGELLPRDDQGDLDILAFKGLLAVERPTMTQSNFDGPVSIFKSVGIGIQDVVIAAAVVQKALSHQEAIGTIIRDYDS